MLRRLDLRSRVFLVCTALVVCLAGGGWWWLAQIRKDVVRQASSHLARQVPLIREFLDARQAQWNSSRAMDPLADWLGWGLQVRVTFILPEGNVVGDSQVELAQIPLLENHGDRPEVKEALQLGAGTSVRYSNTLGVDLLYVAFSIGQTERGAGMILRLAMPLEELSSISQKGYMVILLGTLLGLVLSLVASHLVAAATERELGDLARKARQMNQEMAQGGEVPALVSGVGELDRMLTALGSHMASKIRELNEARDNLETLIQGMVEGVLLTDKDGRILLVNKALWKLMEPRVDPIGRTAAEAFRQADLQEALERCVDHGQSLTLEMRTTGAQPRSLEVQVAPLGGKGAVAVVHDVTERKRMEELRRDLVASVSHELRTPVSAVLASVETLLEGALEDPIQAGRFAGIIHRHALRLQKILEELLDLSRLESRAGGSRRELIRLQDLAQAGLEAIRELAEAKGLQLSQELPEAPALVQGDERQLEQALVNLLENAVNYTEPGGCVTLRITVEGAETHIAVEDTGIGIPPEHLPRIFERFYRVDKDRSRALGGTGLGLSIVKHVVQSHGGRLQVESTPGKGSIFKMILPALVQPGGSESPPVS